MSYDENMLERTH